MHLQVHALTPDRWRSFEDLFESGTVCNRCWCMYWRIGSTYRRQSADENKEAFHAIVQAGPPPGLLAFDGVSAVGWCQLSTRDSVPWLDRQPALRRVDDLPVWCISCFYVRKGRRKQGIATALIRDALLRARAAGVAALEAYPLDRDWTPSTSFTGFATTFRKLGFEAVACRVPARPIMRFTFEK